MTLYTTHRPIQFKDLIGQSTPSRLLQQALLKDKTVNSYIFTGPRGTGKTSSARIFARALTCENPTIDTKNEIFEPCNKCASCLSILNGGSTDYIEIDAASNRGIEDSRNIKENAQYHPIQLKKKIFVIDEVHMLTTEAFNALLKTLEEPPSHAVFILATTEFEKIPLTVRSRCQLVRFISGQEKDIQAKLDSICAKEKIEIENGVTALIAKHAKGGYRDAETILESLYTQEKKLTLTFVSEKLGLIEENTFNNIYNAFIEANYNNLRQTLNTLPNEASFYERLIHILISKIREEIADGTNNNPKRQIVALNQLLEAYLLTKGSPIPSLPLEIACLNLGLPAETNTTNIVVNKIEPPQVDEKKRESQLSNTNIKTSPIISDKVMVVEIGNENKEVTNNSKSDNEPMPDIRKVWRDLIHDLSIQNPALSQLLKETSIHTVEDNTIHLNIRFTFHAEKIKEKKTQSIIQKNLKEKTGQTWNIEYHVNKATPRPAMHKKIEVGSNPNSSQSNTLNTNIINDVSNVFGISA